MTATYQQPTAADIADAPDPRVVAFPSRVEVAE